MTPIIHRPVLLTLLELTVWLLAVPAQAQSFNPETDDAFAPLMVGGFPSRWFSDGETVYWSSNGSDNVTNESYVAAVTNAIAAWNNAMAAKGINFALTAESWTPVLPDTTGTSPHTDSPLVEAPSCLFRAYSSAGNYVCYTRDSAGRVTSQTPCDREDATQICSLFVKWNISGDPDNPDSVQPVRDASGFIQPLGNGRNEIFFEETDYAAAVADFAADPESTLALTVTRALVGGFNFAQIVEADIILNGHRICTTCGTVKEYQTHSWSTSFLRGNEANCVVKGSSVSDDGNVPSTANPATPDNPGPLCYVGPGTPDAQLYSFDIQNVLTHELGHLIGFGHPCDDVTASQRAACRHTGQDPRTVGSSYIDKVSTTTMFWAAFGRQNTKRSLDQGDLNGLSKVFGSIIPADGQAGGGGGGGCSAGDGMPLAGFVVVLVVAVILRYRRLYPLLATSLVVAATLPAAASSVIPLTLEQMSARAELIVEGIVSEDRVRVGSQGGVSTEYHIEILDVLTGLPPPELWVAVPGGRVADMDVQVSGAPRFRSGERAFFFLRRAAGRWIVIGLSQGARPVYRNLNGDLVVEAAPIDQIRTASGTAADAVGSPLEAFRNQVRSLIEQAHRTREAGRRQDSPKPD